MIVRIAHFLDHSVYGLSRVFNTIGVSILMVMMFLVAVDVFLRYVFNAPIEGVYEAIELMMAVVFCYGIAYTQRHKGHVSVNLLISKFGEKTQALINCLVSLISFALFALITWQSFLKAESALASGETTYGGVGPFGHIPIYPFVYLTSAACVAFCFEIFVDFVTYLTRAVRR